MAFSCFLSLIYSFSSDSWDLPVFIYSSSLLCPEHRYPVYAILDLLFFHLFLLEYYYFFDLKPFCSPTSALFLAIAVFVVVKHCKNPKSYLFPCFNSEYPFIVENVMM